MDEPATSNHAVDRDGGSGGAGGGGLTSRAGVGCNLGYLACNVVDRND